MVYHIKTKIDVLLLERCQVWWSCPGTRLTWQMNMANPQRIWCQL